MTAFGVSTPGDGPLFGAGSPFAPQALAPHLRAREAVRLEAVLAAIEARDIERGSDNPPLRATFTVLGDGDRERLLLAPDFRRWLARVLWALDPQAPPGAALPVHVQAAWNQLAIPWLRSAAGERGSLWLLVDDDGRVALPGSGLVLSGRVEGRRVRLATSGDEVSFETENGAALVTVSRRELLAAADGARAPAGISASPRLAVMAIEVAGAADPSLDEATIWLAAGWPAGHALFCGLVRRLVLDPDPRLNSRTESERPGIVFLGRHRTDPKGIAELLVHEAAHLLVYEVAHLAPVLPAPHEIRRSPFSREGDRPAYMVLHATVSFLAQAIATLRLAEDPAAVAVVLRAELERLDAGGREIRTHLDAHGARPHPFIEALFGELAILRQAVGGS